MNWLKRVSILGVLIATTVTILIITNPLMIVDSTCSIPLELDENIRPVDQFEPAFTWYTDSLFDNVSAYLFDANQMTFDAEFDDWTIYNTSCVVYPKFYCDGIISTTLQFRWDPDESLLIGWASIFDLNVIEPSDHGFLFALIVRYPDGFIHAQEILVTDYEGRGYSTTFYEADYDETAQYPMIEFAYGLQRALAPGDELGIIALYDDEYSGIADAWPKYTDGGSGPDSVDTETMAKLILQPDYKDPSVDLTSPVTEGSSYFTAESSVMLNWDASDNYHIDYFDIFVDSTTEASGLSSTTTSYPLTGLTEGTHMVSVHCYDESGRLGTSSITIVVDNTGPSVTITSPVDFFNASSTSVSIDWLASDTLSWIDSQDILVNGTAEVTGLSGSLDTYLLSLGSGYHNITIVSWDGVGNFNSDTLFIRVDVTNPIVTFTTPPDSDYLSNAFVTVQWIVNDAVPSSTIQTTWIYLDDILDTAASGILTQNSWTLSEGEHNVTVITMDYSDNFGRDELIFYVDLTDPLVEITNPPDGLEITNGSYTSTLRWTTSDNMGIDYIEIWIESSLANTLSSGARSYPISTITDATAYTVRVYDISGRFSDDDVVVTFIHLDLTPPSITITSHVNFTWDSSTILLQWNANDPDSGVSSIHIRVDNDPLTDQTLPGAATQILLDLISEGQHEINVTATNGDGFSASVILWINSDDTAPYLNILNPLDDSFYLIDEVNVTWAMHDNVSGTPGLIDRVEVYLDSSLETITSSSWLMISSLDAGSHHLEIRVYDEAGNMQSESVDFWVDLTPAAISIANPVDDFTYDKDSVNEVLIRALITDDTGISSVYLKTENATALCVNQTMTYNGVSGYWEYTWSLTSISPDSYDITITCIDLGGRISLEEISGEIIHSGPSLDTTPPSVSITSHLDNSWDSTTILLQWTANDPESGVSSIHIRIDDDPLTDVPLAGAATQYSLDLLTEGLHSINVTAVNGDGFGYSVVFSINCDDTKPYLIILEPIDDGVLLFDELNVTWNMHDNISGVPGLIDRVEVYVDGSLEGTTSDVWLIVYPLDTGDHTLEVRVYDEAGNIQSESVDFWVDFTPSDITIVSPAPDFSYDKQFVSEILIRVLVTDDTGLSYVYITIENTTILCTNQTMTFNGVSGHWEYSWGLSSISSGEYNITITCIDLAGRLSTDLIEGEITHSSPSVDVTIPNLEITSPSNSSYFSSEFTLRWTSSDSESGINYVLIFIDSIEVLNSSHPTDLHHISGLNDGLHNISVMAFNGVELSRTRSVNVFFDSIDPQVQILSPPSGYVFESGTFNLIWDANDTSGVCGEIDYFRIYHDGLLLTETRFLNYSFVDLDEGIHQLRVVAYDMAGNSDSAEIEVSVDSMAPSVSIIDPTDSFRVKPGLVSTIGLVCLATDAVGTQNVSALVTSSSTSYNETVFLTFNQVTGVWEGTWHLTGNPLGEYTIIFFALDAANHTGHDTIQGSLIPLDIIDRVTLFFENPVYRAITATIALVGTIWGGWKLIRKYREKPKMNVLRRVKEN